MIRQHKTGGTSRASYDEIAGRICMHSDMTEWNGARKPFRVTSDDGRAVIGHELRRAWIEEDREWRYFDDSDLRSDIRVDKSAIRFSCDTAAEAMALMEVSRVALEDLSRVRKTAAARIRSLAGQSLAAAPSVRLLPLDEHDEWVDATTGKPLLSIPSGEQA